MDKKHFQLVCALVLLTSTIIPLQSIAADEVRTLVYVHPPIVQAVIGEAFNISICIDSVTDLFAWQIVVYYQNDIVNALEAFEGPFLKTVGDTVFPKPPIWNDWNATHGRIMVGCTLYGGQSVSGSGVLTIIKFACRGSGGSILKISTAPEAPDFYSLLLNPDLEKMPFQTQDGYVSTGPVPHNVAITSVTPSATEVFAAQIVNINVVSKNLGTTTEDFNVTVCYDSQVIGIETLTDIAPDEETTLQFVWDTSGVPSSTYVIKALADVVPGETIIWNNIYVDSTVNIKPTYDLSVSVEAPLHLVAGESSILKATVCNVGWKSIETNVELQLLIDGNIVNNTVLVGLDVGSSLAITYSWIPTNEGTYTVKAYAPPVPGEEVTVNNVATKTVAVAPAKLPTVQVEPWRDYALVGEFVRVFIHVYDVKDLYAWQIKLHYDPKVLEFRTIWLPDDHVFAGKHYTTPLPKLGENSVIYGASLTGAQSTFDGGGILCVIDFKAKATGCSSLQLDDADTYLLNSTLNEISVKIVNSGAWAYGDTIQITSLKTSRTKVYVGWKIEVNVTVRNNGYIHQTFSVTAYFASEVKATQEVYNLPPGEEATLIFYMDTSPLTPYVDYAIWAEATVVIGETWAYNNFFFEYALWGPVPKFGPAIVTTRIAPDINGDTKVDVRDIAFAAMSFGSYLGGPRWNLLVDINQDNKVDIIDLALIAKNFGKTYP